MGETYKNGSPVCQLPLSENHLHSLPFFAVYSVPESM